MQERRQAPDAYPPELLDDYLARFRRRGRAALPGAAIRTRSLDARLLLARRAAGAAANLDELLAAARAGDRRLLTARDRPRWLAGPWFGGPPGGSWPGRSASWLGRSGSWLGGSGSWLGGPGAPAGGGRAGGLLRGRPRVNAAALADLARVLALQDLLPTDRADALALYDLIYDVRGPRATTAVHQGFHTQLAYLCGRGDRAAELLRGYRDVPAGARAEVGLDLANPFGAGAAARPSGAGQPLEPWLAEFRRLLPAPHPAVAAAGPTPFDRLDAAVDDVARIHPAQLISVVVSAFRPDEGLLTAVRSILRQTWGSVEILVVDDASPAEFDPVLARCLALDPRIRLIKQPANAGTYAARNVALDACEGEFVTFQDSDDWSHPRRLELQAAPLLAEPALVATTSDGLGVTDDLRLTRHGVRSGRFNPSSLLFRRAPVTARLGYFDAMRKAADSEYIGRMKAAFGADAIRHVESLPLALIRLSPNSLSRSEIRAYWMHPARIAYTSAYLAWHEQVAAGHAEAYRPADGALPRPFAAPAHLRTPGGAPPRQDVVCATDWAAYGGSQQLMLDEIRGLLARGLRVGVLHIEAYLPMSRRRAPLCRAVQDLINDGAVTHVQLTDATTAGLLVVRQPAVLQFAPTEAAGKRCAAAPGGIGPGGIGPGGIGPGGIGPGPDAGAAPAGLRPERVLIVADQAPSGRGARRQYTPAAATAAVERLFGAAPLWVPQDPAVREQLRPHLPPAQLADYDLPGVIDARRWELDRRAPRSRRAVIGRDVRDLRVDWAQERGALLDVYPRSSLDVRLRAAARSPRALLDKAGLPVEWLVYEESDLSARAFLHQLDFYVGFPHPDAVEAFDRATLEALAVGCVVVLPPRFADTYGDAAVYCEPAQVTDTVRRYWSTPELYLEQSRRAQARARTHHDPAAYADQIAALLT